MRRNVLGITGGIGSGKSVAAHCLQIMGIPIYNCDNEAKRLNNTHPGIRQALCELVGNHVYLPDGSLDKTALATYLFASPEHVNRINAIIHPAVKEDFIQWTQRQHTSWVAIESAILYESRFAPLTDKVMVVYAPKEIRIARACQRDHTTPESIQARMKHQMSDEEKCKLADYTLYNNGKRAILPQILDILANLFCPSHK
jgi:dephospho-CoA kinase